MRNALVLALALSSIAHAGDVADPAPPKAPVTLTPTPKPKPGPVKTIADAWRALPDSGSACGDDLIFDYGVGGGMRNFFCRTLTVLSWKTFLKLAPTAPFRKGPHKGGRLNLDAERDFGRYDPAFVKWATTSLVPAATDPLLRQETQGLYNQQVRELAHVYFLVDKALSSDPKWIERERRRYLVSMDAKGGGWDVWEITGTYHDVLGTAAGDWGGHDPNHVRSAVMWWLRRHHDDTAALWREGLVRLLGAYDAEWLRDQQQNPFTGKLPAAPEEPTTPEYKQ
jgi:hypothetical protein